MPYSYSFWTSHALYDLTTTFARLLYELSLLQIPLLWRSRPRILQPIKLTPTAESTCFYIEIMTFILIHFTVLISYGFVFNLGNYSYRKNLSNVKVPRPNQTKPHRFSIKNWDPTRPCVWLQSICRLITLAIMNRIRSEVSRCR